VRTLRAVIEPGGQAVSALDRLYLAAAVPTLIVWGELDGIIPVEHAHAAHAMLPGSRLEIFPGAGHFVHVEQPLKFAGVLANFIESTTPARRDTKAYRELLLAHAS
jgi:pimeloyl-ACP methyl ester carboxylesterase